MGFSYIQEPHQNSISLPVFTVIRVLVYRKFIAAVLRRVVSLVGPLSYNRTIASDRKSLLINIRLWQFGYLY